MVEALADSGVLSVNSILPPGEQDQLADHDGLLRPPEVCKEQQMDISARGILVVQEEHGYPYEIKVLVSRIRRNRLEDEDQVGAGEGKGSTPLPGGEV